MAYSCGHMVPYSVRGSTLQTLTRHDPYPLQETPVSFKKLTLAEYFQSFSTQKGRRDTCRSPKLDP